MSTFTGLFSKTSKLYESLMMTLCRTQLNRGLPRLVRHRSSWGAAVRRRLFLLLALPMLLAALPAQAATNYIFSDDKHAENPPAGCKAKDKHGANTYDCGALTLAAGDTISVNSDSPLTVYISAAFAAPDNIINGAGAASMLNLEVVGTFNLGATSNLNANIKVVGAVTMIGGSRVGGDLTATDAAVSLGIGAQVVGNLTSNDGVITALENVIVGKNITTRNAAINLYSGGSVGGNVTANNAAVTILKKVNVGGSVSTVIGVINIDDESTVVGSVSNTTSGAINLNNKVVVGGNISAGIGVITVLSEVRAGGDMRTGTGAINIGNDTTVAGDIHITLGGVVTILARVSVGSTGVGGNITTSAGAVNVGDASRLCGNINTIDGVVTLTTNVKVGGYIKTDAGAVTISGGSTVGGNITTGAGVVTLTNVLVGGAITTAAGDITLTDSDIHGSVSSTGGVIVITNTPVNHTALTVPAACGTGGGTGGGSSVPGSFDCLETGTLAPASAWNIDRATHKLYTKLVSTPFHVDIAALMTGGATDGTLDSNYVAPAASAKTVTLELVDGVTLVAISPAVTQIVTFGATDLGRKMSADMNVTKAYANLRFKVTDVNQSPSIVAYSTDNFAVRPKTVTLWANAEVIPVPPVPSAASIPTITAGVNFTLSASTNDSSYVGPFILVPSKLSAQNPATDTLPLTYDGVLGTFTPSAPLPANRQQITATYSEVGYLHLKPGAYVDTSFTLVDQAAGDCIADASFGIQGDNADSNGKYNCTIGNTATVSLGRFIPDHFDTSINNTLPSDAPMPCPYGLACPPGNIFVYANQPFGVTVTAKNTTGGTTLNYWGAFAHDVTLAAFDANGGTVQNPPTLPSPNNLMNGVVPANPAVVPGSVFAAGVGSASSAYHFPSAYSSGINVALLTAPTDIYLRATESASVRPDGGASVPDGVTSLRSPTSLSAEGGVKVVSGRLLVSNNFGSEQFPLPIKVSAQYWNGSYWATSTTDSKDKFTSSDVKLSNCKKSLVDASKAAPGNCIASLAVVITPPGPITFTLVNGSYQFKLPSPGTGKTGSTDISINNAAFPWLPSTAARAVFGVSTSGPVIYTRQLHH